MSHHTNLRILTKLIIGGFFLEWLFGLIGALMPKNSFEQILSWELGAMSLIAASTLMSVKLARQNWDIPAAGYITLSIAQGVFYSVLSSEGNVHGQMDNFAFASGVILLLPSMLLIFYYKVYPIWLRILGVLVCLPFLIDMAFVYRGQDIKTFTILNGISFGLLQFTALFWSISLWKELKNTVQHS
jgi:hypothetical protein